MVDGKYLCANLASDGAAQRTQMCHQMAYADVVLLNKRDLIDEQQLAQIEKTVGAVNPLASIVVSTRSRIQQISDVLFLKAYDAEKPKMMAEKKESVGMVGKVERLIELLDEHNKHAHEHEHKHKAKHECVHDSEIRSVQMSRSGQCVDLDATDEWLSELLWDDQYERPDEQEEKAEKVEKHAMQIYRMKAVLPTDDGRNHFLSAVQDLYEVQPGHAGWQEGQCRCKLVVIGKHLDEPLLRKGFDSIFVEK